MNRREFLACCAISATSAGCLDESSEPSENENSNDDSGESDNGDDNYNNSENNNESEGESSLYRISALPPKESIDDDEAVCHFKDLPEGARSEVKQTVERGDFETEDRVEYETEESPELLVCV